MNRTSTLVLTAMLAVFACTKAEDDTDTDVFVPDTDTDTDTDSDTDSDTDTDTDSDTDTDTDPPNNLLANPGLEEWGGSGPPTGWLVFPGDRTNFGNVATGDTIFGSTDTFTAKGGDRSLKMYGGFFGGENETPIYQEFPSAEGRTYTMTAWAYMHADDPIKAADTYALLQLKYFDDSYNFFGTSDSAKITVGSTTNTWVQLTVTGAVPAGATKVQAALEFWQCVGATADCFTGGAVYFDDVVFTEVE